LPTQIPPPRAASYSAYFSVSTRWTFVSPSCREYLAAISLLDALAISPSSRRTVGSRFVAASGWASK
jgi:hypothetical protein